MKNRVLTLKQTLLAFFTLLLFAQTGWSQNEFIFTYSGPDTIFVNSSCEGVADWGHPTSVSITSNVQGMTCNVTSGVFSITDNNGNTYPTTTIPPVGTFSAGDSVMVLYEAEDDCGNGGFFGFTIEFVDNLPPVIDAASVPADVTVTCAVPTAPVVNATDNCGGTFPTTVVDNPGTVDYCIGGSIFRTFTATDADGNTATASQNITVMPNNGPSISAAFLASVADVTVSCNSIPTAPTLTSADIMDDCTAPAAVTIVNNGLESTSTGGACPTTLVITRTWTLEDDCGLTFTHTQTIDVQDNNAPVITPPSTTSVTIQCTGVPSDPETQILNYADNFTVTDNCGSVVWTNNYTGLNGTCAGTGTASVTYTASDGCNSSSVTIDFDVQDSNPPNITTGAQDIQVNCDGTGNTADLTAWLAVDGNSVAMDACSPTNLVIKSIAVPSDQNTDDPFAALQNAIDAGCNAGFVATITVEFTYTDDCGNFSTTDADFSILDSTFPTITAPAANLTVECDGAGNNADFTTWLNANGNAAANDVCASGAMVWRTVPANPSINFTCGNNGNVTVDFYVRDACGNENPTPTTATFTIADTQLPIWSVNPTPLTIECDGTTDPGGQIATWLSNNGNGTATDACNPALVTYSNDYTGISDGCGASGSINVMFTANDGCGNSATRTATLTVEDTTPPTWTVNPESLTVQCNGTGDPGGQIAAWLSSVGNVGEATDNCGGAVITFTNDYAGVSTACGSAATITFTAFDACGLSSTRTATVTIVDNDAPTFSTSAQPLTVECDASTTANINDWLNANGNAVAIEPCGNVTWTHDYTGFSAVCPGPGTANVTFTATDECGNSATTSATLTVQDTQAPVITNAPMSMTVQCDTFDMALLNTWLNNHGGATAFDGCSTIDNSSGSANWTFTQNFTANCPSTGVYNVVFTVTDDCGFSTSASANLTVIDIISPEIFPTSNSVTEECGGGDDQANLEAWINNFGNAIAIDGCSNHTWINFDYVTNDLFPAAGTVTFGDTPNYPVVAANDCNWSVQVTFRVTDECNNTSTTTSNFTIEDDTAPVLSVIPADVTVDCQAPAPAVVTATDECAAAPTVVLVADTVMTCANSFIVTRIWTATDDCGNASSGVQIITVEDNTDPTITAPGDVTVQCDNVPVPGNPTVMDMCDTNPNIVLTADTVFGTCVNEYVITRTWTATDACGNAASDSQVVTVEDTTFPTITGTLPTDITVECNAIPTPPVPGTDIIGADNCGLQAFDYAVASTQGSDTDMCNFYNYTLTRTWTAIDLCGNTTVHTQIITVGDNTPPSFTRPANLTVDCQNVNDLTITGNITGLSDNCDAGPTVDFVDVTVSTGSCPQNYTLERTWTVTDACGNSASDVQTIFVQDITAPNFSSVPQNETISCTNDANADAMYSAWIANNGGGVASDLCGTVTWFALEPGSYDINDANTFTTPPAGLGAATCPSGTMGVYRSDVVSFVAADECGNAIDQTVTFTVSDNTPPVFINCPIDVTLNNDPGICGAASALTTPLITDECASSNSNVNVTVVEPFVSPNPGDDQTIVNPITLNFGPLPTNPAVATDPVNLTIALDNYDGEEPTEFFTVLGEDGTTLGQTANSATQCGNSTITLPLTATQINTWVADGVITFTLVPNVTVDPIFAINDICPQGPPTGGGSTATGTLDYNTVTPNGVTYEYSINGGSRVTAFPGAVVPNTFDVGNTSVTYFATDCAGNESSCSYSVTVIDNELPTMACPSDVTVSLPITADCNAGTAVDLMPPTNIFDNCGFQNMFSQVQPQGVNSLITFSYNPNYLDYVADDKSFSFFGTGANAVNGNVTFTVRVEGDVEDADEYFEIRGENGSLLGTTQVGQPNVSLTAGTCPTLSVSVTTITVPVGTFNAWAADGQVDISAISNNTFGTPPPGITGDGISPACTVFANGTPDGTPDGSSNITVVLDYTAVTPTYFASGATVIPNSIFPVPIAPVTHNFNVGVTTVTYQVEDINGNVTTCTFDVTIEDNTAPSAVCQGVTIFVNPDGSTYTLDPSEVDGGSFDNCGIASMTVTPNTFDCGDAGTTSNVILQVTDNAGNISSCAAPVTVQTMQLAPSFSIGLCGDDNLNLFSNAPSGTFTYVWSGPNGFTSFDENPIIPNADATYSGTYVVTITGLTGCTATGAVTISINSAPNTPNAMVADGDICSNEDIVLSTQSYSGTVVTYSWYEGVSPTGTLINTTQVPTLTISNPASGNYSYYVIVEVDGCQSNPSGTVTVAVSDIPVISDIAISAIGCATGNEDLTLTPTVSPANANYVYQWSGPGLNSSSEVVTIPDATSANNGSYTLVVLGDGGCSSNPYTVVVNIDDQPVTPIITSLDNQLCEGDLLQLQLVNNPYIGSNIIYTWNTPNQGMITTTNASFTIPAATVNDDGNYSVMVTVDGCPSVISGNFAVNVNAIPAAPVATYNGPVCEGTTLELTTVFVPGATYFWTGPNNFNSTNQNPVVFPVDATYEGIYSVSIVVNGCPSVSSAPLLVEVNDAPAAVFASNSGPVCLDDATATFDLTVSSGSAIPGATYTWFDAATNTIVAGPTTSLTSTITDLSTFTAGANDFYVVTDVNGCPSAASVPTTVMFDFVPNNGAFAGNDIFVCDNSSVVLNAQAPTVGTGQWVQTAGGTVVIANPNQATTSISGLATGQSYTFDWILSNGSCMNYATDQVTVVVDNAVATADAGIDIELCGATSTTLNATGVTGGIAGTWTQPSSQALLGVTIVDPNDPNTSITGLMPGNNYQFIWTLSNAGCGDFSSDIVVLNNAGTGNATAFAGNDFDLCGSEETPLNATSAPAGMIGTWTTTSGATILAPNQPNTFVTDLQPGANTFTWTLSNSVCGQFSSDDVTIFYEAPIVANDDAVTVSYNGTSDINVLSNDALTSEYSISFTSPTNGTLTENNGVFSYASNFGYVGGDEFTYEICSELCPDECSIATVTLSVGADATCAIPSIFSPNNDGINDEFIVPCLSTAQYPNNEVAIFNQWGDEVFRDGPYLNDWRGTYKGEDLPTGTYFYVVDLGDGTAPMSGFLVLER